MSDIRSTTDPSGPAPALQGPALAAQPGGSGEAAELAGRPASLWGDAWKELRRNPLFIVASALIILLVVMAIVPSVFTSPNPLTPGYCNLDNSLKAPSSEHWFGYDLQGCDVYGRTVYAARTSILVGLMASVGSAFVGGVVGATAAYAGGAVDSVLSRIVDIFFGIPLLLGGIILLAIIPARNALSVAVVLIFFGWTTTARIMRSSVIGVKDLDYVQAARALGAGPLRLMGSHILPNAIAPVIVVLTINLGVFIAVEATLSYLGIGLQSPAISWGLMISDAQPRFLIAPHTLLFPAAFLSATVLAFILLGDAVRDALDPKFR